MKVKIDIDTKTFIRFWLVVIGFILLGSFINLAKDALILVGISFFLALALNTPVTKITKILPGSKKNRVGATAVAYVLLVVVLISLISFLAPMIIEQTTKFISGLPKLMSEAVNSSNNVQEFIKSHNLQNYVNQAISSVQEYSASAVKNLGGFVFGSVAAILNLILSGFMVLVMTFFMLVEGPTWLNHIWGVYQDKTKMKKHRNIASRMYKAVSGFVNGQLAVSTIGSVLTASAVFVMSLTLGVPANLAIPAAILHFLLSLVPMFGTTIAGALISLIVGLNVLPAGFIFAGYFLIYQQIENNLISPMIQAKTNQLSALIVILAITIGVYSMGILGALISIPTAACLKILAEEFLNERKTTKQKADSSLDKLLSKIK